jgi:transcriptional regulator GlxA family with amidase domain
MADKPKRPAGLPATKRIGILVFDGFEPIDVFGFAEAFAIARFLGQGYGSDPPYPFETVLIAQQDANVKGVKAKQAAKVKSMNGPWVIPDWDFHQALKEPLDVLMVPGGRGIWPLLGEKRHKGVWKPLPDDQPVPDEVAALLEWMCAMDRKVPIMASVCTGAAVLAKSGLLDGARAATNHSALGAVAHYGPGVLWDNVARWVDAGKYVTSAGVSAGTDLGFYLVSRLAGRAVAEIAAEGAEYDWHRDPNQPIVYPQQANVEDTY